MTILCFDEAQLTQTLEERPLHVRVVFAAACAERLRPAYLAFSARSGRGDPGAFEAILGRLWLDLEGDLMSDNEVNAEIETCMALIPDSDDVPWFVEQAYAQDAGAALAYALRCRMGSPSQEAAWAGRCIYETIEQYVIRRDQLDLNVPGVEERILSDPLVQAELERQRRDLETLRALADDPRRAAVELRARAKRDAAAVFAS